MNRRNQIAIFAVSITIAVILGLVLSSVFVSFLTHPDFPFEIPEEHLPELIMFATLKAVIGFVNFAMILLTLAIYVDIYRKIKSKFTLGLVLMLVTILMNVLTSNPILLFRVGAPVVGFGIFMFIPDLFTTIALTVLFYLSLE